MQNVDKNNDDIKENEHINYRYETLSGPTTTTARRQQSKSPNKKKSSSNINIYNYNKDLFD
jgi:hypothetical protein